MQIDTSIFRAYDIRGIYPTVFNEEAAYAVAQAYARVIKPQGPVVLGRDVRISSPALWRAVADGLTDAGIDVIDIGTITTDMLFFAVGHYGFGGGITITASHNPKQYNGMKMVRAGSVAISADTGIRDIAQDVSDRAREKLRVSRKGVISGKSILDEYCAYVKTFIDIRKLKPFTIVANANNGMGGQVFDRLVAGLPITYHPLHFTPDGAFPGGSTDPMQESCRTQMREAIKNHHADFGVAWDADADRCVFFDARGEVIHGYYITALLTEIMLKKYPGERVMHDPRLVWAIESVARLHGGLPILNKVGSSFIKNRMHDEGILFAGEASGHYYFREYFCADNGMIPFLLVWEELSKRKRTITTIADGYRKKYPIIEEQNFTVANPRETLDRVAAHWSGHAIDRTDGISVTLQDWRFNVRASNTEPLVRLNAEAKTKRALTKGVAEVIALITGS